MTFSTVLPHVDALIDCVITSSNTYCVVSRDVVNRKARNRKSTKDTSVEDSINVARTVFTSQKIRKVLRTALTFHLYDAKISRVCAQFRMLLGGTNVSITVIIAGECIQSVLNISRRSMLVPSTDMETPTIFDVNLYFHSITVLWNDIEEEKLKVLMINSAGNAVGLSILQVASA